MPYAENDGVKLYYERHGAGDLELLLVPEWCCARSAFAPQVERGVAAWNGAGALAACDVPMLMLLAYPAKSNDPWRLLPLKPDIQYAMTTGSGHFHQLEVPEQVNAIVERFLERVVRKSSLFATA